MIDVNGIQILADFFGYDFEELPNELGGSNASEGLRPIIDAKRNGKESFMTLKTLIGQMIHYFLQQPKSLRALIQSIYDQTGIAVKWIKVEAYKRKCLECGFEDNHKEEKRPRLDECPECGCTNWSRHHVDILTDQYVVEIKSSLMYVSSFEKQISNKYSRQTNYYMGAFGVDLAFVWYLNIAAFKNKFTSWAEMWNKYGYFIEMKFSQKEYDKTIQKFKDVFEYVKKNDYYVRCPNSETWECKPANCDYHEECENPIIYVEIGPDEPKCSHCNHKIMQDPTTIKKTVPAFMRNGALYCKSETCTQAVIDAWQFGGAE